MNPKVTKYLLAGGVLLIWGLIIYRVVKGLGNNDPVPVVKKKLKPVNYAAAEDSFILYANYSDPFLRETGETSSDLMDSLTPAIAPSPASNTNLSRKTIPSADIGSVQYLGIIYNPDRKIKIALIRVGGKDYTARENEVVDGMIIHKIKHTYLEIIIKGNNVVINK